MVNFGDLLAVLRLSDQITPALQPLQAHLQQFQNMMNSTVVSSVQLNKALASTATGINSVTPAASAAVAGINSITPAANQAAVALGSGGGGIVGGANAATNALGGPGGGGAGGVAGAATHAAYGLTLLGRGLTEAGVVATGLFTVPIMAAAYATLKFGSEFETQMMRVVVLAGASREQVDGMRDAVLRLAGDTAVAPEELAKGLYVLMSTGQTTAEAMDTLNIAAQMTALGMGSMHDTTLALTGAMFAYKDSGLTAANAANILMKAVQLGNMEIQDLIPAIARVNPIAAALGVSFEDVAASIATFTHAGVDSATAATGLRAMLNNILTDSVKTEKGFKALQQATGDMSITMDNFRKDMKTKGLTQAMVELSEKVTASGDAGVKAFGAIFPNIRALTQALFVYKTNGGLVVDILKDMHDGENTLAKGTAELQKTWAFQWNQMKIQLQLVGISLSDALLPSFKVFAGFLRDVIIPVLQGVVKWFVEMPGPMKFVTIAFLGILALSGPVMLFLGQMIMAYGNISRAILGMSAASTAATTATGALAGAGTTGTVAANTLTSALFRSTSQLTLLGKATFTTGAFLAGWELGRLIAQIFNLDEVVENLALRILGLPHLKDVGSSKGEETLAKDAAIALAVKHGASERIKYAEAVKWNVTWQDIQNKSLGNYDGMLKGVSVTIGKFGQNSMEAARAQRILLDEVDKFTAVQRDMINAGKAGGLTPKQIFEDMERQGEATGVTTELIGIYLRQMTRAGVVARKVATDQKNDAEQIAASVAATTKLWDIYYQAIEKGENGSIAGRRAGIQTWYDSQYSMILKAVADAGKSVEAQDAAWGRLDALDAAYHAKLVGNNEEYIASEEEILSKSEQMWDEYHKAVAKGDNETLASQVAGINKWYEQQYAAIAKMAEKNPNAWENQEALDAAYFAKLVAVGAKANQALEKIAIDYQAKLAETQLTGTDLELHNIDVAHKAAILSLGIREDKNAEMWDKAAIAIDNWANHEVEVVVVTANTIVEKMERMGVRTTTEMKKLGAEAMKVFKLMKENGGYTADQLAEQFRKAFELLHPELMQFLSDINLVGAAFSKLGSSIGGDIGDIVSGIGTVVSAMGEALEATIKWKTAQSGGQKLAAGLDMASALMSATSHKGTGMGHFDAKSTAANVIGGAATGAMIAAQIVPLTVATLGMSIVVGAAIGGLVGLARSVKKVGDEEKEARKSVQEFTSALHETATAAQMTEAALAIHPGIFGGGTAGNSDWALTAIQIRDAYKQAGLSAADAEAAIINLYNATREGAAATAAAQSDIQKVIDFAKSIAEAIVNAGYLSRTDLENLAQTAKSVYERMLREGTYTAEQLAEAMAASVHAQLVALGDLTAIMIDDAKEAGYKTREELENTADKAKKLYEDMLASGLYTAGELEKAQKASADATKAAYGDAAGAVGELQAEYDKLSKSVEDEAPERIMGSVEKGTRAQMAVLKAKMAEENARIKDSAKETAEATEKHLNEIRVNDIVIKVRLVNENGSPFTGGPGGGSGGSGGSGGPGGGPGGGDNGIIGGPTLGVGGPGGGGGGPFHASSSATSSTHGGGSGSTVILQLDSRTVAEVIVPHIPGAIARHGIRL